MFDPTKHLMKLKGKDYLPVAARVMALRDAHPAATIDTTLIEHEVGKRALFRALVSVPDNGGSATGWGSETVGDFADYLEKAETKALGRALAALGYGTAYALDFDEDGSVADAPIERRPTAADLSGKPEPRPALNASVLPRQPEPEPVKDMPLPPWVVSMHAARTEYKWTAIQGKQLLLRMFPDVVSSRDLTEAQAMAMRLHMELARRMARRMDALWAADRIAEHLADCGVAATIDMTADQLGATEALLKAESGSIGVVGELAAAMR